MPQGFGGRAETMGDVLSHGDPCGKTLVALGRLRFVGEAGHWWKRLFGLPTRGLAEILLHDQDIFLSPESHRIYLRDSAMDAVVYRLLSKKGGRTFLSARLPTRDLPSPSAAGKGAFDPLLATADGFAKLGRVAHGREPGCLDLTLMLLLVPLWGLSDRTFQRIVGRAATTSALYAYDAKLEEEWLWFKSLLCTFYAFFAEDDPEIRRARKKAREGRLPSPSCLAMREDFLRANRSTTTGTAGKLAVVAAANRGQKRRRTVDEKKRDEDSKERRPKPDDGSKAPTSPDLQGCWSKRCVVDEANETSWLTESFRGNYRLNVTVCRTSAREEDGDDAAATRSRESVCNLQAYMADRIAGKAGRLRRLHLPERPTLSLSQRDLGGKLRIAVDPFERHHGTPVPLCAVRARRKFPDARDEEEDDKEEEEEEADEGGEEEKEEGEEGEEEKEREAGQDKKDKKHEEDKIKRSRGKKQDKEDELVDRRRREKTGRTSDDQDDWQTASYVHVPTRVPFNAVCGCPCMKKSVVVF